MSLFELKMIGFPQIDAYSRPVLEVLRDLGGPEKPNAIFGDMAKHYKVFTPRAPYEVRRPE
ncbi:hypothetical protein ACEWPL_019140 [Roseovarius sp. S1116L3]|uniref:hypothetical protein n=1 Tax=Roseovarius roseus TaxID=3342636 RepID=UPI00372D585F